MNTLKWHGPTEPSTPDPANATSSGIWFAITTGLLGVIVGYLFATLAR